MEADILCTLKNINLILIFIFLFIQIVKYMIKVLGVYIYPHIYNNKLERRLLSDINKKALGRETSNVISRRRKQNGGDS